MNKLKNINKEIALTCYQAIMNTTDIEIQSDADEAMLVSVIEATIEGVRKKNSTKLQKKLLG